MRSEPLRVPIYGRLKYFNFLLRNSLQKPAYIYLLLFFCRKFFKDEQVVNIQPNSAVGTHVDSTEL